MAGTKIVKRISATCLEMVAAWDRFWFRPMEVKLICGMRIAVGLILVYIYFTSTSLVGEFLGPNAWIDQAALDALRAPNEQGKAFLDYGAPSLWYFVTSESSVWLFHYAFLFVIACFTLGFCSRLSNLLVLVGHVSFTNRAFLFSYGVDNVLAMLLLYMLLAPVGGRYSIDAWWRKPKSEADVARKSSGANLAIRCIQLHLCIIYLCTGSAKLQGESWWDGSAVWQVVMCNEMHFVDLRWVAHWGLMTTLTLSLIATAVTLFYELSFPLLIWNPRLRPFYLLLAVLLHGGIAVGMGLFSFGFTMLIACASFIPPEWLEQSSPAPRLSTTVEATKTPATTLVS